MNSLPNLEYAGRETGVPREGGPCFPDERGGDQSKICASLAGNREDAALEDRGATFKPSRYFSQCERGSVAPVIYARSVESGMVAVTVVPLLELEIRSSVPPTWRTRSFIPRKPTPKASLASWPFTAAGRPLP